MDILTVTAIVAVTLGGCVAALVFQAHMTLEALRGTGKKYAQARRFIAPRWHVEEMERYVQSELFEAKNLADWILEISQ